MSLEHSMSRARSTLLLILASVVLVAPGVAFVKLLAAEYGNRGEVEHLEGENITQACEFKRGLTPYPDPSSPRRTFLYTPLYHWVTALVTDCASPDLLRPGRVVSLASYLVAVLCLALWAYPPGAPRRLGLAIALFTLALTLTQFRRVGHWYFTGRVDMLGLPFAFVAWVLLKRRGSFAILLAGTAQALAVLSKQSYLLQAPLLGLGLLAYDWGRVTVAEGLRRQLTLAMPTALAVGSLIMGGGWGVVFNVFVLPSHHGHLPGVIRSFWTSDLYKSVLAEALSCVVALAVAVRAREYRRIVTTGAFLAAMVGIAFSSRLHTGGFLNVIIPGVFAITIVAIEFIVREATTQKRPWLAIGLTVFIVATALGRRWGFSEVTPDPASIARTNKFIDLARRHEILFVESPQLNLQAGRSPEYQPLIPAILDDLRVGDVELPDLTTPPPPIRRMISDVEREAHDFIITHRLIDEGSDRRTPRLVAFVDPKILCAHYDYIGEVAYANDRELTTPVGVPVRLSSVFARRKDATSLEAKFNEIVGLAASPAGETRPGCLPEAAR